VCAEEIVGFRPLNEFVARLFQDNRAIFNCRLCGMNEDVFVPGQVTRSVSEGVFGQFHSHFGFHSIFPRALIANHG
jgi:hypothetical protein